MSGGLWFVHIDGEERGPLSEQQLFRMVREGTVRRNTLVRGEGQPKWTRAANVEGLLADAPPSRSDPLPPDAFLPGPVDREGFERRSKPRWPWVLGAVAGLLAVGISVAVVLSVQRALRANRELGFNGTVGPAVPAPERPSDPADAHREAFRRFVGHRNIVNSVAFAPDGQTLLSGGRPANFVGLESTGELPPDGPPDGDTESTDPPPPSGESPVRVWEVETGRQIAAPEGHTGVVRAVAVAPHGRHALSADADGTAILWDTQTWREVHRFQGEGRTRHGLGETRAINAVAFSPDGHRAVLAGWGYADLGVFAGYNRKPHLILWDCETGSELLRDGENQRQHAYFELPSFVDELHGVAWTPDGKHVLAAASGSNSGVYYFDVLSHGYGAVETNVSQTTIPQPNAPDSGEQPDAEEEQHLGPRGHDSPSASFVCAAVSPDGRRVVSGDTRGRLCLWAFDPDPSRPESGIDRIAQAYFYGKSIRSVAFTPDGRYFATGGDDLILWNGRAGKLDVAWELGPKPSGAFLTKPYYARCVAFSGDAKYLAAGCDDCLIRLWKVPQADKGM